MSMGQPEHLEPLRQRQAAGEMDSGKRLASAGGQDQNASAPMSVPAFVPPAQLFQRDFLVKSRFLLLLLLAEVGQVVFSIELARQLCFCHEAPTVETQCLTHLSLTDSSWGLDSTPAAHSTLEKAGLQP